MSAARVDDVKTASSEDELQTLWSDDDVDEHEAIGKKSTHASWCGTRWSAEPEEPLLPVQAAGLAHDAPSDVRPSSDFFFPSTVVSRGGRWLAATFVMSD